jgi:hypothetical protein
VFLAVIAAAEYGLAVLDRLSWVYVDDPDDLHVAQGHAGAYRDHGGRVIGIDCFVAPHVDFQFLWPVVWALAVAVHNAPGDQPTPTFSLQMLHDDPLLGPRGGFVPTTS